MQATSSSDYLPKAITGALIALLGWLGKQLVDWVAKIRGEERKRRARIAELLAILRAGDAAWKVQRENRNRLRQLIEERDPDLVKAGHGFDRLFALAFPNMPPPERELHTIVRAITIHTFCPLNEALLKWLASDTDFRVRPEGDTPRSQLAKYLTDLEAHLLLWQAKYKSWIPDHPERALVYLADEERHGVGFPKNGVELVSKVHKQRWIGV